MTTETTHLVDAKQRRFRMLPVTVTVVPARIGWRVHEEFEVMSYLDSSWHLKRAAADRRRDEIVGRLVREGYMLARDDSPQG